MYKVQILCCIAFTIHAIVNLYITLNPQETVMRFEPRNLDDIEFPIIFKICLNPAFKIDNIKLAGYASLWDYFHGKSKYNKNKYFGWAGHYENGSVISSVEEIQKEIQVDVKDILSGITLKFTNARDNQNYFWEDFVIAKLLQINHPNNCHEIDITKLEKNLTGLNQINFVFNPTQKTQVEILLEDRKGRLSRNYQLNKFGSFGSRITIENLMNKRLMYYAAEFEQSIFDEEDSNSNCKEYTNTTYDECDKIFIKNFFLNNFEGFMPIWATENISEVTKFWNSNGSNMHSYHKIFDGTMDSGCLLPCTKTKIRTVYINEKVFDRRNISRVELIFSRSVKRKIYSFPQFNFFTFLTSIGGTAGLWLGLGIIQVSEYLATFMNPRIKILLRKSKK